MKTSSTLFLTAFLASVIITGPSFAAPPATETEAPGQSFVHPSDDVSYSKDMRDDEMLAKSKATDNGQVQYVSGGIAVSGMRAIDAEQGLYNLKLLFVAQPKGEYLANIGVKIKDGDGKTVLDTTTKGPVLLVKLPTTYLKPVMPSKWMCIPAKATRRS
jgi:hypothetical protein